MKKILFYFLSVYSTVYLRQRLSPSHITRSTVSTAVAARIPNPACKIIFFVIELSTKSNRAECTYVIVQKDLLNACKIGPKNC
jgi:hypothetical protein